MKQHKDNPVPSLDDLFKEFSHSNKEQGIFSYNEFLKSKLQYGVETNNEQPKCTVCGNPTDRKHAYQNIYVCIDCSH